VVGFSLDNSIVSPGGFEVIERHGDRKISVKCPLCTTSSIKSKCRITDDEVTCSTCGYGHKHCIEKIKKCIGYVVNGYEILAYQFKGRKYKLPHYTVRKDGEILPYEMCIPEMLGLDIERIIQTTNQRKSRKKDNPKPLTEA